MESGWRKGALERNSTHGGPGIGDPDWVVARRGLGDKEGEGGGRTLPKTKATSREEHLLEKRTENLANNIKAGKKVGIKKLTKKTAF